MKNAFFKTFFYFLLISLLWSNASEARVSYSKTLKKNTRESRVFSWDNFEVRMIWNATHLSPEFREAKRQQIKKITALSDADLTKFIQAEEELSQKYDLFFVGIYAGSSLWKEIGKNSGEWHFYLESSDGREIPSVKFERIKITQLTRELYPYLDSWTEAYLLGFPKTLLTDAHFKLRMGGIPAKSELRWK